MTKIYDDYKCEKVCSILFTARRACITYKNAQSKNARPSRVKVAREEKEFIDVYAYQIYISMWTMHQRHYVSSWY